MSPLMRLAALVAMLALAGCVTVENPLSQNDVAHMKLTTVSVSFAPKALVVGYEGPPEALGGKIRAGMEQAMAGQLVGTRPVRLDIVAGHFKVPSVASRILIGSDPTMEASATLVDANTDAVILADPKLWAPSSAATA